MYLSTAAKPTGSNSNTGRRWEMWKDVRALKKEHVNHSVAVTHIQSPLPLSRTLSRTNMHTNNSEGSWNTYTHANNYAHTVCKQSCRVMAEFLQAGFSGDIFSLEQITCNLRFSTHHLKPFIPGTLHNSAVGSVHIQPKLPP